MAAVATSSAHGPDRSGIVGAAGLILRYRSWPAGHGRMSMRLESVFLRSGADEARLIRQHHGLGAVAHVQLE